MWITEKPIHISKLLKETEDKKTGAIVVFLGSVREDGENDKITGITYHAHKKLASKMLQKLEKDIEKNTSYNSRCRIVHRIGYVKVGEISIAIVIRTPHRKQAYRLSKFVIDKIKKTIPIWKEEHLKNGEKKWVKGKKMEYTKL